MARRDALAAVVTDLVRLAFTVVMTSRHALSIRPPKANEPALTGAVGMCRAIAVASSR